MLKMCCCFLVVFFLGVTLYISGSSKNLKKKKNLAGRPGFDKFLKYILSHSLLPAAAGSVHAEGSSGVADALHGFKTDQ